MENGKVTDATRIERVAPTIREIADKGGKVILLVAFRPAEGASIPKYSLKPVAAELAESHRHAGRLRRRLHRPEAPRPRSRRCSRARSCAWRTRASTRRKRRTIRASCDSSPQLGDIYVNDAFSAAHRAHASTEGLAHKLPGLRRPRHAGRARSARKALEAPQRPVVAIVGGAKISTKLDLLGNLLQESRRADHRRRHGQHIPAAQGQPVGKSLVERDLVPTARDILAEGNADARSCCRSTSWWRRSSRRMRRRAWSMSTEVADDEMILDIGPRSVEHVASGWRAARRWSGTAPSAPSRWSPSTTARSRSREAAAELTAGRQADFGCGRRRYGGGAECRRRGGSVLPMSRPQAARFWNGWKGKPLPGVEALR